METIICKNDLCSQVVPTAKNPGRPREFCNEGCRKRYNQRLSYQRATKGASFVGLRGITNEGYPQVHRKIAPNEKAAKKRVEEHQENCTGPGVWCLARNADSRSALKMCLVKAVFDDDWETYMWADTLPDRGRQTTTLEGMWIDDYAKQVEDAELRGETLITPAEQLSQEIAAFEAAGGAAKPEPVVY